MIKNKRLQVQSRVVFIYSAAQTENAKSMSYHGLSQRGINEKSVCRREQSAKQHGQLFYNELCLYSPEQSAKSSLYNGYLNVLET
jgi:hypothetical protein